MRSPEERNIVELVETVKQEQRELGILQKKYEGVQSAWLQKQRAVCELEALLEAHERTYRRSAEPFFQNFRELLQRELASAISEADTPIGDLPQRIGAVKDLIYRRLSIVRGSLHSFISDVVSHKLSGGSTPQCSPALMEKLKTAREKAEGLSDIAALIELIEETAEFVEGQDSLQHVPLLRLDLAVRRAVAVGAETAVAE